MGIDVRDPNQTVGTLSGGERQAVAIARAVYFGAQRADPRRADLGARRASSRGSCSDTSCRPGTDGSA